MKMTRRTLLIGAGVGALSVLLASCTPEPVPSPTPTRTPTATPPAIDGPVPVRWMRSMWATDPFARGATAFTPVGTQPSAREALVEPVERRVYFAGEATDDEAPGTMRGAMRSGERVAADLRGRALAGERIAVVGAGLSGATAASILAAGGADVTVFEARDRVGGRVHSIVDEEWPVPVQLGGWLLGSDDTLLRESFDADDARVLDLVEQDWRTADGAVEPVAEDVLPSALTKAQEQPADSSILDALAANGADTEDPALIALLASLAASAGGDADALSSWFPPGIPPQTYAGPALDLNAFVEDLLGDVRVSLSSPVSRVAYDDTGVSLRLGTGESLSFDRVILTVPLGVLQNEGVEFAPALPLAHRGALGDLGVGQIETIWLRFDARFWESDAALWHAVGGDGPIRTWFNLQPSTGEPILVGLVGGAAAAEFAALGDDEAITVAMASLSPFTAPDQAE